ncbi:MAG: DUF4153 domain-containing protein [Patescibacteria group bacterium]
MTGAIIFILIAWVIFFTIVKGLSKSSSSGENSTTTISNVSYPKYLGLSIGVIVFAFNIFLYGTFDANRLPVLGLAAFNFAGVAAVLLSMDRAKRSIFVWLVAALSVAAGFFSVYRANGFVQSVNTGTMLVSNLLLFLIHVYDQVTWSGLWLSKNFLRLIPQSIVQVEALTRKRDPENDKRAGILAVLKTVAITAVVLVFFASILSSADPVFAEIIKTFREQALARTIASLLLAGLFVIFVTQKNSADQNNAYSLRFLSFRDLLFPGIGLVTLFAVFLFVQANYLFGNQHGLDSFNLTYSEYVRKGFTELLVATFFGGLLSYIIVQKSRLLEMAGQQWQLRFVNVALIAELFLLLVSALKRDLMYVEVYGLTRVRIVGGIFLVWLAGFLLLLLVLNLFKKFAEKKYWTSIAALSAGVVLSLNIINIDQMVVNGAPAHHDYSDYFYINNLSEDGYLGWSKSINDIGERVNKLIQKKQLSDEEKSQLAGDKLALIALQEKRTQIMFEQAPESWLLANACDEKHCRFENKNNKNDYYYNEDQIAQSGWNRNDYQLKINKEIIKGRNWKFFNYSQLIAYKEISNNQQLYFSKVDGLLQKIRQYQMDQSLDLYKQETWFIDDFSYPFINIKLDYQPQKLTLYEQPSSIFEKFDKDQVAMMSNNQIKMSELEYPKSCSKISNGQELNLVVMASRTVLDGNDNYTGAKLWDDSSKTNSQTIFAETGPNASFRLSLLPKTTFGKAKLKVSKFGPEESCFISYQLLDWQEIKKFE